MTTYKNKTYFLILVRRIPCSVENYNDGCIKNGRCVKIRDLKVMNNYKREIPPMCRGGGF
jgi:hypothetical protein